MFHKVVCKLYYANVFRKWLIRVLCFKHFYKFSEWYKLFCISKTSIFDLSPFESAPAPTCSHLTAMLLSWVSLCPLRLRDSHTPQPCCWAESLCVCSSSDMLTPHSHVAQLCLFESAPAPTCSHPTAMSLCWVSLSPLRLRQAVLEIFPT